MADIQEGYGLIAGRSRSNAQAALDAAKAAGVEAWEVTAVPEGYIVPVAVLEHYHGVDTVVEQSQPTPTEDWKNAEIKEWAEAHDVDLAGATTKADMLAAIAAAGDQ